MTRLERQSLADTDDVFALRQVARDVGAVVGFDEQDQVRIATAVSEAGRDVLGPGGGGDALIAVDRDLGCLVVEVRSRHPLATAGGDLSEGLQGAARLLDSVETAPAATRHTVRLTKRLPAVARHRLPTLEQLRSQLGGRRGATPLDELMAQNRELLEALDRLSERERDLRRVNAELEETNRGVLAMYAQLSEELDETNRGVVALYAELDQKTAELRDASEAKSRFLASVSHELRSPVNSILGLSRLLLDDDSDPLTADQRRQVGLIGTSATDLLALVNDLLDLGKAESGRLAPTVQPVDLASLFAELRGTFRPLMAEDVLLDVAEAVDVPVVETDRALLSQVLRNLLSNATKFTEHGSVSLFATPSAELPGVDLTVSDTGIGIAPEHLERVFEEFFQVAGPLQTRRRGSGLGLPYVRHVVEALGGHLEFESALGEGTRATVRLPVQWSAVGETLDRRAGLRAVHVESALIVDDDPAFREVLRGMLEGMADQVLEATDGIEALTVAGKSRPDVVFLDLGLPGLAGADVLEAMTGEPELRDLPVVVVTSAEVAGTADARLRRASGVLGKTQLTDQRLRAVLSDIVGTAS